MINFLKLIKSKIDKLILFFFYNFSKLIPKEKKNWCFIGWHKHPKGEIFADNCKYLFLHTSDNVKSIRSIWIAKSRSVARNLRKNGYASYYQNSLLGIWHALRSQTTIIDAYIQPANLRWSGNSQIIQLTHGRGMKKEGYNHKQPCTQDLIFCTSEFTREILPEIFTTGGKVHITGFPRNDIFFKDIPGAQIDVDQKTKESLLSKKNKNKIILYSPTFRRGEQYADIESRFNFKEFSIWLEERNLYFVFSLHPKYRNQDRKNISDRILFLEECDIYPILPLFDLFINDYSSIFADQLLLNKPMIFYPFDLAVYSEREGLMFDYVSTMPGPKVYNFEQLLSNIENILVNDSWKEARENIKNKYHQYKDGDSSRRIVNIILSQTITE